MICTITIYKLCCPITNEIRYVGITTKSLTKRLASHINAAQKTGAKTHRESWIRGLLNKGLKPLIEELETFKGELKPHKGGYVFGIHGEREKYWISKYLKEGANLTNYTDGGDGFLGKQRYETYAHRCKQVDQYTKEGIFIKSWISASDAATSLGNHEYNGKIIGCCKGAYGRITAFGYMWRYKGESFDSKRVKGKWASDKTMKIAQYSSKGELLKIWEHSQQIEDVIGISRSLVCSRCIKPLNDYGKFRKPLHLAYFFYEKDIVHINLFLEFINNPMLSQLCIVKGCLNKPYLKQMCYKHHYSK
jgi:hypothetical protein